MIIQDNQTGALHQVPDHLSGYGDYGAEMLYDGLGNPVGRLSGIFDDIGKAIGSAVSSIPVIGPALSNLVPGVVSAIPGAVSAIPGVGPVLSSLVPGGAPAVPPLPIPPFGIPSMATPAYPMAPGLPSFPPSWPSGWVRPPLPYTGLSPTRLYMRCAMWPGPRGLVPAFAQNGTLQPAPIAPPSALPYRGWRRHHRHHRR